MKFTDYLAIYAALISTLVFVWNIFQSRPRIKVDLIFGVEGSGDAIKSGIYVTVRNLSSHDIHLSNIDILYQYRKPRIRDKIAHMWRFKNLPIRTGWIRSSLSNYSLGSGFPVCLEARKSHMVLIPQATVETILTEATDRALIACVQDQLWNNVYSRKFKYPVADQA